MTTKEKKKYRRTPQWKALRVAVIQRDKICQICGQKTKGHIHHYKEYTYGHETLDDLVLLCKACHLPLLERRLLRIKNLDIEAFCRNLLQIYKKTKES